MLAGYIDESYTGENEPITFGLNCAYTTYPSWFWIEAAWKKVLVRKNKQLLSEGRRPIKRYHSKEISNFENEFNDWSGDERTELTRALIAEAINGHFLQSVGFTANLKDVGASWPRVKFEGVKQFGYHVMMRLIMMKLEMLIPKQFGPGAHIMFINERCDFDWVLSEAFNFYREKRPHTKRIFTSITPMGWENCIPLQPADFLAYEAMKETNRLRPGQKQRERRKSLSAFLELENVGASCDEIPTEEILRWKSRVEERDRQRGKAFLNERFDD